MAGATQGLKKLVHGKANFTHRMTTSMFLIKYQTILKVILTYVKFPLCVSCFAQLAGACGEFQRQLG